MDIDEGKVDIQSEKVDIESVLFQKTKDFSVKAIVFIHRMFEKFGFDGVFGRSVEIFISKENKIMVEFL